MTFTRLKPDHIIFKSNRILERNDIVYETKSETGKTLIFWVHGDGVLSLHPNPETYAESPYRAELKRQIFGNESMKIRLSPAN